MYFRSTLINKRKHIGEIIFLTFLIFTSFIVSISAKGADLPKPDKTAIGSLIKNNRAIEQHIIQLSKHKWQWIVKRQTDSLDILFDIDFVSLAPGIRMDKAGYLDVIKNGISKYNKVSILETEVQVIDNISILYTKVAFAQSAHKILMNVTEVYKNHKNSWKLIRLQVQPVR